MVTDPTEGHGCRCSCEGSVASKRDPAMARTQVRQVGAAGINILNFTLATPPPPLRSC